MAASKVFVEVDGVGNPIRIIRLTSDVWKMPSGKVRQWPKADAVRAIRDAVFARADGCCEFCGRRITKVTGEMHEKTPKGDGGEVSLENSVMLCHFCHTGRADSEHGTRRWTS